MSRPGSGDGAVRALGPAGAELQHRSPLGRPDDPVGLGGDQALVVDGQQGEGLDQLGLDGRRPDRHHRLPGEDRR
ncbi:putative transcriptional regulator, partial [Dysosmobacter welbionis]